MVLAGPFWVLASELLRSTFYVALRQAGLRSDLDREWLARLNASKIRAVLVVTLGGAAVLGLPWLVLYRFNVLWSWLVTVGGLMTGPVAAMFGKSGLTVFAPNTGPDERAGRAGTDPGWRPSLQSVLAAFALVFAAALAMLAGYWCRRSLPIGWTRRCRRQACIPR